MRFDELVVYLGEFGPYQKKIYFLLCYPMLVSAFQKLMWVFVAADLQYMCDPTDSDSDNTTNGIDYHNKTFWNSSPPWNYGNQTWDKCKIYAINQSKIDGASSGTECSSWIYDTSQYSNSVVSDFNLVCHRKWLSALTMSMQMGGEFFGSVLLGILSDKYGRKKVMVISAMMLALSGVMASFANGIEMLIFCRVMVGFWTPGMVLTSYVVGMEFVGPSKRVFAGVVCQYFFAMGYILIAVAAYFIRSWRPLTIILSVPGLVVIVLYWLVPESARWLFVNNRKEEAIKIINDIAISNKVQLPEHLFSSEIHVENKPKASLKDLMRYPKLRKRTFIVLYCWFVNTCVYYGLSLNTSNLAGNNYINFALAAAVEFPAYTVCLVSLDRIGRRMPLCLSMIVGGIVLFIIPFIQTDHAIVAVVLSLFGKFAITVSYAIVYMFSTEVFPTSVRSASCGAGSTCGRVGAMLAPFMLLLGNYWLPLPPILFSIFAITAGSLSLFLPETLGRELPDTIEDGESFTKRGWSMNNGKLQNNESYEIQHLGSKTTPM
ncbi:hypothetical protein CHUAL_013589 [Chamberlinius hualienensis]